MDVQLYLFINGTWQEYNPKPAVHNHTISEVNGLQSALNDKANNNDVVKLSGTQTITGKKTITTNDLNMDGASVAYIRPNTTGGWARGFWWQTRSTDNPANTRIGGIGVLGNNQSVSYFYIGYGSSPWTNPAVEVRSDYTNIRNGLKLNGNDVATVNLLSGYSKNDHTHNGVYEPVFTKNTAFNKNFGTGNGDVARGDHTHTIANITNLQTTLNGKANSSHTHTIANITNLQSTLDKKIEPQSSLTISGNCNNARTNSIYEGSWASNRPTGAGSNGTLITTQTTHESSSYVRQIYLSEGSTKMYTRYSTSTSTWGAWEQIGTMSLSGTTLNITL